MTGFAEMREGLFTKRYPLHSQVTTSVRLTSEPQVPWLHGDTAPSANAPALPHCLLTPQLSTVFGKHCGLGNIFCRRLSAAHLVGRICSRFSGKRVLHDSRSIRSGRCCDSAGHHWVYHVLQPIRLLGLGVESGPPNMLYGQLGRLDPPRHKGVRIRARDRSQPNAEWIGVTCASQPNATRYAIGSCVEFTDCRTGDQSGGRIAHRLGRLVSTSSQTISGTCQSPKTPIVVGRRVSSRTIEVIADVRC
jgi:hypothetical protein